MKPSHWKGFKLAADVTRTIHPRGAGLTCVMIEDIAKGRVHDVSAHASLVRAMATHIKVYAKSFCYGYHGIETDEEVAALISAVGWRSGWRTLFSIV